MSNPALSFDECDITQKQTLAHRVLAYGWWPILVGAAAMAATYPGRTHGLGMVTEPLLLDFGLADPDGRVFFASLNFWATLLGAAFCLPVGWLFDRYDQRVILAANLVLLGISVIGMSFAVSWQALFLTLILTRGLGQSALSVVSLTVVAKAFEPRRIGMAMAWYAILSVPFHLLLIKGVGWALSDGAYSWRRVWACVGASLVALCLSALPIGRQRLARGETNLSEEPGATLFEALRTPAFWVFSLTISIWGMIYAGVALFNVDIFKERGFDEKLYFNVLAVVTVVALVSKLLFGWLVNYVSLTRLLSLCLLLTAVSLASLPMASQVWHAYAYAVLLGVSSGAVALLFFATWRKFYGLKELGRIQGAAQMLTVFASASGPLLFSYSKKLTLSYDLIFQVMAGQSLLMAIAAWLTPLPAPAENMEQVQ